MIWISSEFGYVLIKETARGDDKKLHSNGTLRSYLKAYLTAVQCLKLFCGLNTFENNG